MNVYEKITGEFIELIESGVELNAEEEYSFTSIPTNFASKKHYQGVNFVLLSIFMMIKRFNCGYFMTFNQIQKLGGKVKKGAKSIPVIYYNLIYKDKDGKTLPAARVKSMTKEELKAYDTIPFVKYTRVFNFSQTEGIDINADTSEIDDILSCDAIIESFSNMPDLREDSLQPYYNAKKDYINMPGKNLFSKPEYYYSTMFHEMIHSTGHADRLNRDTLVKSFNEAGIAKQEYSKEELVAEFGAAMLCSLSGIASSQLKINSANYLKQYLTDLKNDSKFLFDASKMAQSAVNYILGN